MDSTHTGVVAAEGEERTSKEWNGSVEMDRKVGEKARYGAASRLLLHTG